MPHFLEFFFRLFYSIICFLFCVAIFFFYRNVWLEFFFRIISVNRKSVDISFCTLGGIFTSLTGIFYSRAQISYFLSLLFSVPVVCCQFFFYFLPSLYVNEQKVVSFLLFVSLFNWLSSFLFWWYLFLPNIYSFFFKWYQRVSFTVTYVPEVGTFIDLIFKFLFLLSFSSQLPIFLFSGVFTQIWSSCSLSHYRRFLYLLLFLMATFVSPPDIKSQIFIFIRLIFSFEVGIISTYFVHHLLKLLNIFK